MTEPNRNRSSTGGVTFQEPESVKLRSTSQSQAQPPASTNNRTSGVYSSSNRNDRSSRVFSNLQETMNQMKSEQEAAEAAANQSNSAKKSGGTVGKKQKGTLKSMGFQFSKNKTPVMANTFIPPQNQVSQAILDKWKLPGYPESGVSINESFLKGLGVGFVPLGADAKDWVGEFLQTLFEKLEENSEKNPLLPKANRTLLKTVIEDCSALLENQSKLEKIIKIQSHIRGYLVRKRLKNWKGEQQGYNYTQNPMYECIIGFRDLFQLERNYITSLKRIVDIYLGPLRKAITSKSSSSLSTLSNLLAHGGTDVLIPKEDMNSIFGNVEDILKVHMKICQHFEGLYAKWPFINNVGETFLKFAPQLTVYGPYVSNSKNSLDTLFRCQQQQPKFKQWLEDTAIQTGEDLMGLLVKPLNYINQYQLLLKLWTKKLPPMHRDMANLRNAYVAIKRTNKFIQENYQESTNRAKILDIQRRLGNAIELNQPKRAFIGEGEISTLEKALVLTSEKVRHYFLFKDLILFCQEDSNKNFKLLNTFVFKETTLTDDTQGNQYLLTLAVTGNPNSALKLSFKTREDKVKFGAKVKELIDNTKVSRVFAVQLPKLLEREKSHDGIPFVVKCTMEHVKKHKETEGIFRLSGSTAEVKDLKQFFNEFEEIPKVLPDLSKFNVHSVCAILKMFFRELPEPLMTFQAYKPATQINIEDGKEVCVQAIKEIVTSLPEQNFKLLKYLMTFLNVVAQHAAQNKMTAANLAIVFGPNLLFPAEESIESILNIPKLNIVFQIMLENYSEIFPSS